MSEFTEVPCGICGVNIDIPKHAAKAAGIIPVCFNCMKAQRNKADV